MGRAFSLLLYVAAFVIATAILGQEGFTAALEIETAVAQSARRPCYGRCRFILCRSFQNIMFGAPLKRGGPSICRRGQDIGFIKRTGEALVRKGTILTPISSWRPEGLSQSFPANFFLTKKTFAVEEMSSVVKRPSVGNQNDFLDGTCFVLPIQAYERNFSAGVRVVRTSDPRDCLSFRAIAPDVIIEAQWFSGDDMDLSVIEPNNGDRVSNENKRSECGELVRDNGVDSCGRLDTGREVISYSLGCSDFKSGTYRALLKHSNNCGLGPTKWEVRIVVEGRLVKRVKGTSNGTGGVTVANVNFTL